MADAVLFDLGNTLVAYFRSEQFQPMLRLALSTVARELERRGMPVVTIEAALEAAAAVSFEAGDHRFNPLGGRLERIFRLASAPDTSLHDALCDRFLEPIFAVGRVYDDTVPVLTELRESGLRIGIVSNLPWGSPPAAWRRELQRLGLTELVDSIVLCGDVGWRKPAPQIFHHAARELGVSCGECVFVGDDLTWDIEGSTAVGMRPILIDRDDRHADYIGDRIRDLHELVRVVKETA